MVAEQPFSIFVIAGNHDVTIEEFYEKGGRGFTAESRDDADEAREILCANDGFIYLKTRRSCARTTRSMGHPDTRV